MGVSNYGLLEITSSNPSRGGNKTFEKQIKNKAYLKVEK